MTRKPEFWEWRVKCEKCSELVVVSDDTLRGDEPVLCRDCDE